jgi:hypothetical protein
MASSVPIAVTPAAIFQDARPAAYRFNEFDVTSTVAGFDRLLRDQAA